MCVYGVDVSPCFVDHERTVKKLLMDRRSQRVEYFSRDAPLGLKREKVFNSDLVISRPADHNRSIVTKVDGSYISQNVRWEIRSLCYLVHQTVLNLMTIVPAVLVKNLK